MSDGGLFEKYKATINDYLSKGYAKKIPDNELDTSDGSVWYLPHHPVINPQKPDKVRVVFDCAAKYRGTSLNDHLLQGPDLTNSLIGVLIRFQQEPVAMVSDIEAMFHQVRVEPKDCNALRFLWWPEDDLLKEPTEHQMLVHLLGATSSPTCSNFRLRKTAHDNRRDFDTEIVHTVERNVYVDDCLKSVRTTGKAVEVANQTSELLARGGFKLTKWLSYKREVIKTILESERAKSVLDLELDKLPVERTLGIQWDVEKDTFRFKIVLKEKPKTRREILSATSSVYDPLGFIAPIILPAKKLLQDLTRQKFSLDHPVCDYELARWNKWTSKLPKLSKIVVDRCLKPENFDEIKLIQLHHFADASQTAYSAASYVKMVNASDEVHCAFLIGKSRLAPLKTMTIPRLELAAAVLAVKLNKMLQEELDMPIHASVFWTDSMTVLQYIANETRRFHTFVANRLAVIHDGSETCQWRHVNTDLNPADDATRGLAVEEMIQNDRWLVGPAFLWKEEKDWPIRPDNSNSTLVDDPEIKCEKQVNLATNQPLEPALGLMMKRYSSWYGLKKAVAWLTRFKQCIIQNHEERTGRKGDASNQSPSGDLIPKEIQTAESDIVKYVQSQSFPEVIKVLQATYMKSGHPRKPAKRSLKKSGSFGSIFKLNPALNNEGLLRVGGRLKNAPIIYEARHPLILPYKHDLSDLIVMHYHRATGHAGQDYVLSNVRQKFWIMKGRSAVRRVIRSCFSCRRRNATRGQQIMADIPKDRLTPDKPPFTNVGVDFFGPLFVRHGRGQNKRYGACSLV